MDITKHILDATSLNVNWKHFDFYDIIDNLSSIYIIHHEIEEEKIAIIQNKNEIIGYIYMNYPIIFINDNFYKEVITLIAKYDYIEYIIIDSIYHKYLNVDKKIYNKYFNYMENLHDFSAEDFYFYNIV